MSAAPAMKLFAVMCNQPERLGAALVPVRAHLRVRAQVTRWGLAYMHGGEVLLVRTPKPAQEVDLASPLEGLASDCVVAQAVGDSRTSLTDNTPPFRFRRWMFAQLGAFDVPAVWQRAIERVPEYLRRNMRSKEPGELAFHLFLAALAQNGPSALDEPNLPPALVRKALAQASRELAADLVSVGAEARLGSCVVANGRIMVAVRREPALRLRRLWLPNDRGERDERFRCVLILSSDSAVAEDGFEELMPGQIAIVRRDLTLELSTLDA